MRRFEPRENNGGPKRSGHDRFHAGGISGNGAFPVTKVTGDGSESAAQLKWLKCESNMAPVCSFAVLDIVQWLIMAICHRPASSERGL